MAGSSVPLIAEVTNTTWVCANLVGRSPFSLKHLSHNSVSTSKSWRLGGPSSCWGRTIGIIAPGLKVLNLCFWLLSSGPCGQTWAQSWHLWKCISQISVSTCYLATSVLQAQRVGFKMQNYLVFRYASMPPFGIKLYICSLVMSLPISLKVGKLPIPCQQLAVPLALGDPEGYQELEPGRWLTEHLGQWYIVYIVYTVIYSLFP